jgi:very-short-patch-repair endonuclease
MIDIEKIKEIISQSKSYNDCAMRTFGYSNSKTTKIIKEILEKENLKFVGFYEIIICKECGKNFKSLKKRRSQFCCKSCSVTYNNKKRVLSNETKKKISESTKDDKSYRYTINKKRICDQCGNEFTVERIQNGRLSKTKFCSEKCRHTFKSNSSKETMKRLIGEGKHNGWNSRNIISYPEQFFIDVLNNHNIKFQHNFPIKKRDLGLDEPYSYFLDFFIKDKMLDLEIDGKQHQERVKSDKKRDKILIKNGYYVYRIKWKNINTKPGKKYIEEEIKKFLTFYDELK